MKKRRKREEGIFLNGCLSSWEHRGGQWCVDPMVARNPCQEEESPEERPAQSQINVQPYSEHLEPKNRTITYFTHPEKLDH
jgi:hypothetical protein